MKNETRYTHRFVSLGRRPPLCSQFHPAGGDSKFNLRLSGCAGIISGQRTVHIQTELKQSCALRYFVTEFCIPVGFSADLAEPVRLSAGAGTGLSQTTKNILFSASRE